MKNEYQLIIPAGGKGIRIQDVTKGKYHKAMLPLNGNTLIERLITDYYDAGIRKVVVLTGYRAEELEGFIRSKIRSDEFPKDLKIDCSRDPEGTKPGNAGAILNALDLGFIDEQNPSIVHNPDDIIIAKNYPRLFIDKHEEYTRMGAMASVVVVPSTKYPYSSLRIGSENRATAIKKYPEVQIPTHTGVSLFNPEIYKDFREFVSLDKELSFEDVILPYLARTYQLYAIALPSGSWLPINDLKGYNAAKEAILNE